MAIQVGDKWFKTKTSLTKYCGYILNNTNITKGLSEQDELFMKELFKRHYNYKSKTKGMDYKVGIRLSGRKGNYREFYIIRSDGTETDISYVKAISTPSNQTNILKALRALVYHLAYGYKLEYFENNQDNLGYVLCAETGLKIKLAESHTDHHPMQFADIVKLWIDENNLDSSKIKIKNGGDNSHAYTLVSKKLRESFTEFYKSRAQYRIVLDKVNLQRARPERFAI